MLLCVTCLGRVSPDLNFRLGSQPESGFSRRLPYLRLPISCSPSLPTLIRRLIVRALRNGKRRHLQKRQHQPRARRHWTSAPRHSLLYQKGYLEPLESTVHCPALPSAPSYVPAGQLYPAIRTRSQASKQSSEKKQGQGKERLPVQPAEYRNRNRYLIDNDRRLRPTPPSTNAASSPENNFFFYRSDQFRSQSGPPCATVLSRCFSQPAHRRLTDRPCPGHHFTTRAPLLDRVALTTIRPSTTDEPAHLRARPVSDQVSPASQPSSPAQPSPG
jgi:hypothetical protein